MVDGEAGKSTVFECVCGRSSTAHVVFRLAFLLLLIKTRHTRYSISAVWSVLVVSFGIRLPFSSLGILYYSSTIKYHSVKSFLCFWADRKWWIGWKTENVYLDRSRFFERWNQTMLLWWWKLRECCSSRSSAFKHFICLLKDTAYFSKTFPCSELKIILFVLFSCLYRIEYKRQNDLHAMTCRHLFSPASCFQWKLFEVTSQKCHL